MPPQLNPWEQAAQELGPLGGLPADTGAPQEPQVPRAGPDAPNPEAGAALNPWERAAVGETPASQETNVMGKTAASVVRGVLNVVGLPGALAEMGRLSTEETARAVAAGEISAEDLEAIETLQAFMTGDPSIEAPGARPGALATPQELGAGVESLGLPLPEFETPGGRIVGTGVEFATGGLMFGPGGAALSGLSGSAGQFARELGLDESTSLMVEFITPLVLALGRAGFHAFTPSRAERIVEQTLRDDKITPDEIKAASDLINQARTAGFENPPTWGQAIAQVTEGRAIGFLHWEQLTESVGSSREIMRRFALGVDDDTRAALGRAAGAISEAAPAGAVATEFGSAVQQAIDGMRFGLFRRGRAKMEPIFNEQVTTRVMTGILKRVDDAIEAAPSNAARDELVKLRNSLHKPDARGRIVIDDAGRVTNPPRNTIGELDAAWRTWRDAVAKPKQGGISVAPSIEEEARRKIIRAHVLPVALSIRDDLRSTSKLYDGARREFEVAARQFQPIEAGPMGRVADAAPTLQSQRGALFGPDASAEEITQLVRRASRIDPNIAPRWVRDELWARFDGLAKTAEWKTGSFINALSTSDGRQIEAFLRGLPGGEDRVRGFRIVMTTLEAFGKRLKAGGGDFGGGFREAGRGRFPVPFRLFTKSQVWFDDVLRLGNFRDLANMLTDPHTGRRMTQLTGNPRKRRRVQLVGALIADWVNELSPEYADRPEQETQGFNPEDPLVPQEQGALGGPNVPQVPQPSPPIAGHAGPGPSPGVQPPAPRGLGGRLGRGPARFQGSGGLPQQRPRIFPGQGGP